MTVRFGIDVGSTTTKAVLLDPEGSVERWQIMPTGADGRTAARALQIALLGGRAEEARVVATGYGRALVDFADKKVTEITCHARGVRHLHPDAAMVVDMGGQDSKVIRMDADGRVEDFGMNDRCAAGTGSFLDVIARRFDLDVEELGDLHTKDPVPFEISSTCAVFAETEVVSLLAQGCDLNDVLAGVQRAIANRVVTLIK
ncbi:MAG: acyl-CoA dehydratase activase, partial [Planctomycetota bacterium]